MIYADAHNLVVSESSSKGNQVKFLISEIKVEGSSVTFKNYIDDPVWLPFGVNKSADLKMLDDFFEDRCFPRERVNCKEIVHNLGLDYYEPELICRKTHGLQFDNFIWLQFSDEPQVTWNDIKLRD
jgi:hypothetical protein